MDTFNAPHRLLNSDPAIRYQILRDLTDTPPADLAAERARIPREGLGAIELFGVGSGLVRKECFCRSSEFPPHTVSSRPEQSAVEGPAVAFRIHVSRCDLFRR